MGRVDESPSLLLSLAPFLTVLHGAKEMSNLPKPSLTVFSVPDVASVLGVNREKIRAWIRAGLLKAINVSAGPRPRWRISQQALDEFLESRTSKPAARATRRRRTDSRLVEEFF